MNLSFLILIWRRFFKHSHRICIEKNSRCLLALEHIPDLYDWTSELQGKNDSNMNRALEEFAKRYAIESGISLSNLPSVLLNKNLGISKGRMNAYGLDVPVGISNKPFVYAFIDVVIRMPSVVKHRFGLTSQKAALFVLYTLQHLPFFNLQTDFRNIKTSKLWPALIYKDGQTSAAVAPGPFVSFIITSLRHKGPLDYEVLKNSLPLILLKGFAEMLERVFGC